MDPKNKWNKKYSERINEQVDPKPNPRLMNLSPYLTGGLALDLACGLGGNSLFLAGLNYQVQAIDISEVAINFLQEQAKNQNLEIIPRVADLTKDKFLENKPSFFDLVVISYYLERSLFPCVKKCIKRNGYFFMETYYLSPQTENKGISNQYKLQEHELLAEFKDWHVLFFEENEQEGRQTIFCQK